MPDKPNLPVPTGSGRRLVKGSELSQPTRFERRPQTPEAELFKLWLRDQGWRERGQGPLGTMLELDDAVVAVPHALWADPVVLHGLAERVARASEWSVAEVVKRIWSPMSDRVELRLIGESLPTGRVPLGAASDALRNGRRLLSATGTSAIAPGWSVARRYRSEAQDLARDAELAHTEDGSFIFPLYVALERAEEPPFPFDPGSVVPEPFERRVTRTLATALVTTSRLVEQDVSEISDEALDQASLLGVTRELCVSLNELLRSPAVQTVEFNFDWSPAFGTTESLPKDARFEDGSRPQLRRLARKMARDEPIQTEVYSGPILEIGQGQNDGGFYFVLDTYYFERSARLRVFVSEAQHESAIAWYHDRATVIVEGAATLTGGRLYIDSPRRIEAWGNLRLEHPTLTPDG